MAAATPADSPVALGGAAAPRAAQSQGPPGDAFLALLVAGLDVDTAPVIPNAPGDPPPNPRHTDGVGKSPGKPVPPLRGKSKDRINELACVAPSVLAEPPAPLVTCMGQTDTAAKISGNPATYLTSADRGARQADPEASPPRPIAVDDRDVSTEEAADSAVLPPQTAFEALIRTPGVEQASSNVEQASSNVEQAFSNVPAPDSPGTIVVPAAPASPRPVAPASAAAAAPAVAVGPEPGARKEGDGSPESGSGEPAQPQQATKPSAKDTASSSGQQLPEAPGGQKRAADGGHDVAEDPASAARAETPFTLSAPATPVADPVPPSVPRVQSAADPAPANPSAEAATTRVAASPARDISLQLPNPGGPRVDVQLTDRAGSVHVVVRTEDNGLARDLRTNLPELTQRLSQQGVEADAWGPGETHGGAAGRENPGSPHEQSEGRSWYGGSPHGGGGNPHGGRRHFEEERADEESGEDFSKAFTGAISWPPVP